MEFHVGQQLLHYRLLRRLGAGGGGEVWEAKDERLGRKVALKVPPAEVVDDPRSLGRFEREAQALARLTHPNVVRVLAIEAVEDRPFLVLELIEGRTVAAALRESGDQLSAESLLEMGAALASALRAVHAAGVIHRDLKPENVMLTTGGGVKVIDFGVARLAEPAPGSGDEGARVEALTRHGTVMGTCPYMAPEQVRGRPADARSDLFALGTLLYEAATGERAFDGATDAEVFAAVLETTPPPLTDRRPDLPAELAAIVSRCLEKDPERRFRTAREAEEALLAVRRRLADPSAALDPALFPATEEVPLPALADSAEHRTSPRRRVTGPMTVESIKRHPLLATTSALLLAVAVVFLAAGFWPADAALAPGESLMVLPFTDATQDEELAYVSEGLSAGLASRLGEVSRFRVIGMDEARAAVEAIGDPAAAARRFGAARVLAGEVQRRNDQVHVSVRLTDGRSGDLLWADEAEAPLASLLDLQGRLVDRVGRTLAGGELSSDEIEILAAHPTASYEAFEHYLRGAEWLERVTTPQYDQIAAAFFREAIAEDPDFALAHVGLSEALWSGYHERDAPDLLDEARGAAETALALDPGLAEAHAALAKVQRTSGETRQAIDNLESVLSDHPERNRVLRELAASFRQVGQLEDARSCLLMATGLSPEDWLSWNALGAFQFRQGEYEQARQSFEQAAAHAPEDVTWPRQNVIAIDVRLQRYDEAIAAYESIPDGEADAVFETNVGTAYYYLDRFEEAERHFRRSVELDGDRADLRRNLGDALLRLGEREAALEEFRTARDLVAQKRMNDPEDEDLRVAYTLYTAKAGECAEAAAQARDLRQRAAASAQRTHDLAAALALCGDPGEALAAIRDAIAQGYPLGAILDEDEFRSLHRALDAAASAPLSADAALP